MRKVLTLGLVLALMMSLTAPAGAITDGTPDRGEHPMVGQLLFYVPDEVDPRFDDPGSWFTCTGTLIAETVVLTAGHCTFGIGLDGESTTTSMMGNGGNDVWVNFEEIPDYSFLPPSSGFVRDGNAARYEAWEAALDESDEWHRGTATSHPDYDNRAFVLADAGIVHLMNDPEIGAVATIADEGYLEQFATRRGSQQRFTAVGYGLESGFPRFGGGDTRLQAEMKLVSLRGAYGLAPISVAFSSNPGQGKGGTCFGDSGGPVFEAGTTTIIAVTSFGVTLNCVEPGGFYRIDTPSAQAFINANLAS